MHTLRPPEELVEKAIEEIDVWLTEYAAAKRKAKYLYLKAKRQHYLYLRVILAEIKRLRAEEEEHD